MPKSSRPPSYRHHKARDLAVVTIDGHNHYLGPYGSPESRAKYAQLIGNWQPCSPSKLPPSAATPPDQVSINELILLFLAHAAKYYRKNGKQTGEFNNIRYALRWLKNLYGRTPAAEFSARKLEAVRDAMIGHGWKRKHINCQVSRIKRMFRWAATEGLVSGSTHHALAALEGLKWGRSDAVESVPVSTVDEDHVQGTCEHLSRHVRAMVQVQLLTGMRSQDTRNLRTYDLDMTDDVWVYTCWTHKTEHHGHTRRVAIGPRAQAELKPFLKPDDPKAFVFSPKDVIAELQVERRKNRKTPLTPSQRKRRPKKQPKKVPGNQYTHSAYVNAVIRATKRAGVPHWTLHQLRHNCGTRVRQKYGLDAAAAVLGHKFGTVTEVYAEADLEKAKSIMREIG